ncbi:DUF3797 domain-containing protein [Lysinibacillus sp. 1P01SD]|uniref:DUF3797 domain-containing protein n=1 Tax=Lysinibacillus sp. 1P01SD TaxID=3132285 RepID=UPI0039A3D966
MIKQTLLFEKLSVFKCIMYIFKNRKCANCGSILVGDGEGHFVFTEEYFKRECKCGCKVESFMGKVEEVQNENHH